MAVPPQNALLREYMLCRGVGTANPAATAEYGMLSMTSPSMYLLSGICVPARLWMPYWVHPFISNSVPEMVAPESENLTVIENCLSSNVTSTEMFLVNVWPVASSVKSVVLK